MRKERLPDGRTVTHFTWDELGLGKAARTAGPIEGLAPMGGTETDRRIAELTRRNQELQARLGEMDRADVDGATIEELERENEALEGEIASRQTTKQLREDQMNDRDIGALRALDSLAKSATADHRAVAKRCEDLMEARVETIAEDRGVSKSRAHGIASKTDGVYKRAYALLVESQDRAVRSQRMGDGLGAHI